MRNAFFVPSIQLVPDHCHMRHNQKIPEQSKKRRCSLENQERRQRLNRQLGLNLTAVRKRIPFDERVQISQT